MSDRRKSLFCPRAHVSWCCCSAPAATIPAASAQPLRSQPLRAAGSYVITIHLYAFTTPASVPAGATVTIVNKDAADHTVTSTTGKFDVPAPANQTTSFTAPSTPGSYPFFCTIHPDMHGTLVVVAASGGGGGGGGTGGGGGGNGGGGGGQAPHGPVETGDGGSITSGPNTALAALGVTALVAGLGALVLWRRSAARS